MTRPDDPSGKTANIDKSQVQGEGNYDATRRFDKAERDFVQSGKVEEAKGKAAPRSPEEAREMTEAEQVGKSHSKGEAPADKKGPMPPAKP